MSSVAFGDVLSVSVQYNVVKICNVLVEVIYGSVVECAEVLFCFLCEPSPVCSFVVCECASWIVGCGV